MQWNLAQCSDLADRWLNDLGETGVAMISSDQWRQGQLVQCPPFPQMPDKGDIKANAVWMRSSLKASPAQVPSQFLLADAFLQLHEKLNCKLLNPSRPKDHALQEAAKLKLVHQVARRGFRRAASSRDPVLQELKGLMNRCSNTAANDTQTSASPASASSAEVVPDTPDAQAGPAECEDLRGLWATCGLPSDMFEHAADTIVESGCEESLLEAWRGAGLDPALLLRCAKSWRIPLQLQMMEHTQVSRNSP